MKNQIGFLGVGQAGSNIALEFERLGYDAAYLNTSLEDLESLKYAKHKIHINGGEGASKNRKAVLKLASQSIDTIFNDITSVLTQEYIMILFSAGGGTGSGLSPVIASYLSQSGRKVVLGVILPDETKESPKTCENAYNTCVDISGIDGVGNIYLLDNFNVQNKFDLNTIFAKDIDALLNCNGSSKYGNIDKSEIKTILETHGVSIITRQSKAKSSAQFIINGLNRNIYSIIEDKSPIIVGLSTTNRSLSYDDIYKEIGYPYDDFRGMSDTNTICVACGYSLPIKRINKFKDKVSKTIIKQENIDLQKIDSRFGNDIHAVGKKNINNRELIMNFLNN